MFAEVAIVLSQFAKVATVLMLELLCQLPDRQSSKRLARVAAVLLLDLLRQKG